MVVIVIEKLPIRYLELKNVGAAKFIYFYIFWQKLHEWSMSESDIDIQFACKDRKM